MCKAHFHPLGLFAHQVSCRQKQTVPTQVSNLEPDVLSVQGSESQHATDLESGTVSGQGSSGSCSESNGCSTSDSCTSGSESDSESTEPPAPVVLSEYERKRLSNIQRNNAALVDLGLLPSPEDVAQETAARDKGQKERRHEKQAQQQMGAANPVRRSARNTPAAVELAPESNTLPGGDLLGYADIDATFEQVDPEQETRKQAKEETQTWLKIYQKAQEPLQSICEQIPEQDAAFAKLVTSLHLSVAQSDAILGYIKEYGSRKLPATYKTCIHDRIKHLQFPMDEFEFAVELLVSLDDQHPCPGYKAGATATLKYSDPLWLAQELLMDPVVMGDKKLIHFAPETKRNAGGQRVYSELYTGTWFVCLLVFADYSLVIADYLLVCA